MSKQIKFSLELDYDSIQIAIDHATHEGCDDPFVHLDCELDSKTGKGKILRKWIMGECTSQYMSEF